MDAEMPAMTLKRIAKLRERYPHELFLWEFRYLLDLAERALAAPRKLMREQVEAAISSVLGPAWIETRSQITDKIMKLLEVEPAPPEVGK